MASVNVTPPPRRSAISVDTHGLQIVIPADRRILLLLFLTVCVALWGVTEFFGARRLLLGPDRSDWMLILWFAAWTYVGTWTVYTWLWTVFGKEIVKLNPQSLTIKRDIFGMGATRGFAISQVRNMRVSCPYSNPFDWFGTRSGFFQGTLAFDYGAKTFRFGIGLPEAEASQIVDDMKKHVSFSGAA